MVLPAVRTTTRATRTSPCCVPAGSPMVSVDPPVPLLAEAAARSAMLSSPGCGVGVGVMGVGVGVGGVGVGVAVIATSAGLSAIRCVILDLDPPLWVP